ncbi:hydroxymethylbilane synthase [Micromonospora sp. M42]|nr:hydroxymethylbilane synthase [Micromonospora sp. M42]
MRSTSPSTRTRTCPPRRRPACTSRPCRPGRTRATRLATDGRTLAELPPGARVGTGALRRIAQLHALGMQLEVTPIRGNIDTRLSRVLGPDADLDAVVLARAGLNRIGRADVITETLDPMLMLPAPAQGALAVECRADDQDVIEMLALLDHEPSRAAITAERALLATLEAGCSAPVAAYAVLAEGEPTDEGDVIQEIYLRGAVISPDGSRDLRLSRTGTPADAAEIGKALAAELLELGADSILGQDAQAGPGTQQLGSTE